MSKKEIAAWTAMVLVAIAGFAALGFWEHSADVKEARQDAADVAAAAEVLAKTNAQILSRPESFIATNNREPSEPFWWLEAEYGSEPERTGRTFTQAILSTGGE